MFDRNQAGAQLALSDIDALRVVLAKPQTFMNTSGEPVSALLHWYRFDPERLLVVYDDMDLPVGAVRIRPEGSSGGHKGMASIIERLGTSHFPRLRIGIGRASPPLQGQTSAGAARGESRRERGQTIQHVLSRFSAEEDDRFASLVIPNTVAAIRCIVSEGPAVAMNRFNRELTDPPED